MPSEQSWRDWLWNAVGDFARRRRWWRVMDYAYNRNVDRWLG